MKDKLKQNSGFTLIELIIALGVLAFLMTAVSSFMASSVLNYKKSKADVEVHTSAQGTYDQMADSIMQATDVIVLGYVQTGSNYKLVYIVKDEAAKDALEKKKEDLVDELAPAGTEVMYFSQLDAATVIYVKQLITYNSVNIDTTYMEDFSAGSATTGTFDNEPYDDTINEVKDESGNIVGYDTYDTKKNIFTFDGKKLYYEKKFKYMKMNSSLDECPTWPKEAFLFNDSFEAIKIPTGLGEVEVSNCTAAIDTDNGAIEINYEFNNKNMTYSSIGMINIKNSYVLKAKK